VAGPKRRGGVCTSVGGFLSKTVFPPLLYTVGVVRLSNGVVGATESMELRLVQFRSLKPYTCNAEHPFRLRGRVLRTLVENRSGRAILALLEPWPSVPAPQQTVVVLVCTGDWTAAGTALAHWDVVEVQNAQVVPLGDICEARDHGLLDSCLELHEYAVVLGPDQREACCAGAADATACKPALTIFKDAGKCNDLSQLANARIMKLSPESIGQTLVVTEHGAGTDTSGRPVAQHESCEPVPRPVVPLDSKHHYLTLEQLRHPGQMSGRTYDVYGVIVDVRAPRLVRTGELLTELQIIDPSIVVTDSDGRLVSFAPPQFMLTSFSSRLSDCVPYIGVGDVVRVHRAELRWFPQQSPSGSKTETLELKTNSLSSMCLWPALAQHDEGAGLGRSSASASGDLSGLRAATATHLEEMNHLPDPLIYAYPSNTKSIVITNSEKCYAMELLRWARALLSQSGFLGSKAFSATLRDILQSSLVVDSANGSAMQRLRYDLVVLIRDLEKTPYEFLLKVTDGSISDLVTVSIAAECWTRLTHRLEPHLRGNWFRLRDVRLDRRPGLPLRLTMNEGSSIYKFPQWMPEVQSRMQHLGAALTDPMCRTDSQSAYEVAPVAHQRALGTRNTPEQMSAAAYPILSAPSTELNRERVAYTTTSHTTTNIESAETGIVKRGPVQHPSCLRCSGPPLLQTSSTLSIPWQALRPQSLAHMLDDMRALRSMRAAGNACARADTPMHRLYRVYACVCDVHWIVDADSRHMMQLLLTDLPFQCPSESKEAVENQPFLNDDLRFENRKIIASAPTVISAWVLDEDLITLCTGTNMSWSTAEPERVEAFSQSLRYVLTMPFVWIDVLLVASWGDDLRAERPASDIIKEQSGLQPWVVLIEPVLRVPLWDETDNQASV